MVARICPVVPVALSESRSSPVTWSLEIVEEARYERPEAVKLVVEAFVEVSFAIVPDAAVRSVTVVVAKVVRPFEVNDEVAVIVPPVIVLLVSEVKNAVTPLMRLAKKLVEVLLVVEALVAKRLVEVLLVVEALVAMRLVIVPVDALSSVIVPDAAVRSVTVVVAKVVRPFEVNDEVAVIVPPVIVLLVSEVKNAVTPLMRLAKKLVEVAFVVEEFVAAKLVAVALSTTRDVTVVVANVEVPDIRRVPDAERSPCAVAKNLRFSVHDDPFQ